MSDAAVVLVLVCSPGAHCTFQRQSARVADVQWLGMADDRDFECLVTLAEELHFGRAAARLGIAQPALSKRIQRLEAAWGVQLFVRGRHAAVLTSAGAEVVRHARRVQREYRALLVTAASVGAGQSGTVRIGAVGSAFFEALPRLLRPALQKLPGVELRVEELETPALVKGLESGELQIGFLRPPVAGSLKTRTVWEESLVVAVSESDVLAHQESIDIAQLAERELAFFSRSAGTGYWDHVAALFYSAGVSFQPSQRADHVSTLLGLVSLGNEVTIVPESARNLAIPGVRYVPMREQATLPLAVAASPVALNPAAHELLSLVLDGVAEQK